MLPLIPLLSMLPTVLNLFKNPSKGDILKAGLDAVKIVSGVSSSGANIEQDIAKLPESQQKKVLELMMKREDIKSEINLAWLENTKDARSMYRNDDHKMADTLAERIMKWNLPVIVALVICNILAVIFMPDVKKELIAIVSNFIGIAIGQLFNERQAVVNFFFGSSKSSRDKDEKK